MGKPGVNEDVKIANNVTVAKYSCGGITVASQLGWLSVGRYLASVSVTSSIATRSNVDYFIIEVNPSGIVALARSEDQASSFTPKWTVGAV